jgi:dynein heavy chain
VDLSGIKEQLERPGVKKIQDILELASSSYLQQFLKLSDNIQVSIQRPASFSLPFFFFFPGSKMGSAEAQDNLKFLQALSEPCTILAKAEPEDIPQILPMILNQIRMIWGMSGYYNSPERLTGLLRKVRFVVVVVSAFAPLSLTHNNDNR